mmetsp:Transcript_128245/g.362934  ORF Transcript_128245/g.362934 Transcript_128245/m.362934 type:complete len:215 (+) Transcript_128245:344-988(+)
MAARRSSCCASGAPLMRLRRSWKPACCTAAPPECRRSRAFARATPPALTMQSVTYSIRPRLSEQRSSTPSPSISARTISSIALSATSSSLAMCRTMLIKSKHASACTIPFPGNALMAACANSSPPALLMSSLYSWCTSLVPSIKRQSSSKLAICTPDALEWARTAAAAKLTPPAATTLSLLPINTDHTNPLSARSMVAISPAASRSNCTKLSTL